LSPLTKPQVFVTRAIPEDGLELLRQHCDLDVWPNTAAPSDDELISRTKGKDGILTMLTDKIDAAFMDTVGPQLKVISQYAVGYDNIDTQAAQQRGIAVGNTPGVLTEATADIAFALLLATARRIVEAADYVKAGQWKTWEPQTLLGADLNGATMGIIGLGRIGQAFAQRAKGFNMRLIAYSPRLTPEKAAVVGAEAVSFETLLRESDFISLHSPLTAETRHLINAEALAKMKPTAILINTARGGMIDQDALYNALRNGTIRAAGLDVTDPEPLPSDHPLLQLPNALIIPHIGSASIETRTKMSVMAAENLLAGLNGTPLPNSVL
jgi:glyoxylate reductase